ncbi:hypothetical protein JH06_3372 [Blastocystis sp. subtype 4]|uniref:hypothetical protein n=1 Tax=Blastocystis sp. subtype 4 TaxID=944170 RepID=UPI0007121571|nr:hypothetical protein JH06_3372 [Blastocystis sp. subtype 4]KNB43743.1 hypothetical protein JH06_3372 [Blastocystis sp. subtype 4]|eukprot:XP_014527186.1 hypothetical protein JH06_3372 [Blastocystis sp. subtype 4]
MQSLKEDSCLLFSSTVFPHNARIKDKSSIPWGVAIHPLNPRVDFQKTNISQQDLPRCQKCFGYLNMYCMFDSKSWRNSLDGRYLSSIERSRCPECVYPNIILESDLVSTDKEYPYDSKAREILVLVIDCTSCNEFLQFIKSTLNALISSYRGEADILIFTSGDRLGIYNIKHSLVKILYTRLVSSEEEETSERIPLISVMSFDESSANLATYRSNALGAISSIQRLRGEFCFAETMRMVTEYLHNLYKQGRIIGGRLICSIFRNSEDSRINPYGDNVYPPSNEQDASNRLRATNSVYYQIMQKLQQIGLSCDILNNITDNSQFGVTQNRIDPVLLQQLCASTNGNFICVDILNSESVKKATQHVLSFLQGEYGFDCVFRIRSSGGVVITNIGDSLSNADNNHDIGIRGLQFSSNSSQVNRISFIHSNTVIPFDFQYNSPKGSTITIDDFPLIQLVVEYTTMKTVQLIVLCKIKVEKDSKLVSFPIRRMRISSVEYKVSTSIMDIYSNSNPSVIIYMLLHKTLHSLTSRGFEESRLLLREWLLAFFTRYMMYIRKQKQAIDYTFKTIPKLKIVPKYIYSSILGPFLNVPLPESFASVLQEVNTVFHLSPLLLSRYLYPQLSAYKDENSLDIPRLNLSLRSLIAVDRPFYLYVSYDRIVAYSNSDMIMNDPNSLIEKTLQRLCDESKNCFPICVEFWTSERDGELFRKLMIDDNSDPSKCFATLESSIIDVVMQTLMNRK